MKKLFLMTLAILAAFILAAAPTTYAAGTLQEDGSYAPLVQSEMKAEAKAAAPAAQNAEGLTEAREGTIYDWRENTQPKDLGGKNLLHWSVSRIGETAYIYAVDYPTVQIAKLGHLESVCYADISNASFTGSWVAGPLSPGEWVLLLNTETGYAVAAQVDRVNGRTLEGSTIDINWFFQSNGTINFRDFCGTVKGEIVTTGGKPVGTETANGTIYEEGTGNYGANIWVDSRSGMTKFEKLVRPGEYYGYFNAKGYFPRYSGNAPRFSDHKAINVKAGEVASFGKIFLAPQKIRVVNINVLTPHLPASGGNFIAMVSIENNMAPKEVTFYGKIFTWRQIPAQEYYFNGDYPVPAFKKTLNTGLNHFYVPVAVKKTAPNGWMNFCLGGSPDLWAPIMDSQCVGFSKGD